MSALEPDGAADPQVEMLVEAGRANGRRALEREIITAARFSATCDELAEDVTFTTLERDRFDDAMRDMRDAITFGGDVLDRDDLEGSTFHAATSRLQAARAAARAAFNEAAEPTS